jgi:uncharacterized membrane protein YjfL (UPF0719 family)
MFAFLGGLIGVIIGALVFQTGTPRPEEVGLNRLGVLGCLATGAILGAVIGAAGDITTALGGSKPLPRWFWIGFWIALGIVVVFMASSLVWLFMPRTAHGG